METTTVIVLSILGFCFVGIIGYLIMIYNGLISVKENIKKSWGNIDVILKQRYDEIPKLISVCESYAQFEKGMLDTLIKSREKYLTAKGVEGKAEASNQISAAFRSIFAYAENYPELKANENFLQLQGRISHLEESLADRREFYNDSVNNFNIRIQQIPDAFVAGPMGLAQEVMFKVSEEERQDVKVKINLPKFD